MTNAGPFTHGGSGQTHTFSLPAKTPGGTYTVSYTATVDERAIGALSNGVIVAGGGDSDPSCTTCSTTHEVLPPDISVAKKFVDESGPTDNVAEVGETLTYEITLTNEGGFTDSYAVQDVLDEDLVFESADPAGVDSGGAPGGGTVDWTDLQVPARGAPGVLVLRLRRRSPKHSMRASLYATSRRSRAVRTRIAHRRLALLSSRKSLPLRLRNPALMKIWTATAPRAWETRLLIRFVSGTLAISR